MTVPDYRIASVWLAVKNARRTGSGLVVLPAPEEVEAAERIKSVKVCRCNDRREIHIHTHVRTL